MLFLLAPLASAGAGASSATGFTVIATTTTTSTIAIVGSVLSGVAGGAGMCWYFFKPSEPSSQHQASLEAQNRITEDRINNAKETVGHLSSQVQVVTANTTAAKLETAASIEGFSSSVEKLEQTSKELRKSTESNNQSLTHLASLSTDLKEVSAAIHVDTENLTATQETLNKLLSEKDGKISRAKKDINVLKTIVEEQAISIDSLNNTIKSLSAERDEQEKTINQLNHKVIRITTEAERSKRNCQFFKAVAQKAVNQSDFQSPRLS